MRNHIEMQKEWEDNSSIVRWDKTGLLDGIEDSYVKLVTATMLENQRLANTLLDPIDKSIELVSKIVPNLLAHKIVSVQPKLGPNSNLFFTKFTYESLPEKGGAIIITVEQEGDASRTRKLKNYEHPVTDVDALAKKITDEINREILTDLSKNCGTIATVKKDDWEAVYNSMASIRGCIHRKTLRSDRDYWVVTTQNVIDRYKQAFTPYAYKLYIVDTLEDNCILMGQKGKAFFDSDYIYSPYIMLTKMENAFLIRYGKKLTRSGSKSYGKIMLPPEETIDFSTLKVNAK